MKFTASTNFNRLAIGVTKQIQWKVYARKTTALSNSIVGYSGWLDITGRIIELPSLTSQIEYEYGQFKADSIELVAMGITWFDANLFNTDPTDYIELKIEAKLGYNNTFESDIAYMFFGFLDYDKSTGKPKVKYNDRDDSVSFSVFTPEDIGSRFAAEHLTTQFIEYDTKVDASNVQGIILHKINACFVTDVDISSYELSVGVHTITYTYDSSGAGTRKLKLDDGDDVTLTGDDAEYTLSNSLVTEKVNVWVRKRAQMPTSESVEEKIIVKALGSTLPYQFYQKIGGYRMLEIIYNKIGITSLSFDTLQMNTYDSRYIVSHIDLPPADEAVNGTRLAITSDGTYLYTAVGTKVYKRNMTTNIYTLLTTVTASHDVYKLMYNARNGHLWILFSDNAGDFKLRRLLLADNTYSDVTLYTYGSPDACILIDYNYTGSSWKYGVVYSVVAHDAVVGMLRFIDSSDMSDNLIINSTTLGSAIGAGYMFLKNGNDVRYGAYVTAGAETYYFSYTVSVAGAWVDAGVICPSDAAEIGAYNIDEDAVYYLTAGNVCVQPADVHTPTVLKALLNVKCIFYNASDLKCYCIGYDATKGYEALYGLSSDTITELDTAQRNPATIKSLSYSTYTMTNIGAVLYGIDASGRLFQYNDKINFYIENADCEGVTVTDALYKTLKAFNLMANISAAKKAYCYRRGNDSGTIQTTGNNIALNISITGELEKESQKYEKFDLIKVTGETSTVSYNGSSFTASILSDGRTFELSNPFIPDKITKDLAYYMYQFFKTSKDVYRIINKQIMLLQYEPFDGATLIFTTTRITKSGTGVILSTDVSPDGIIAYEVLI